ncbi:MAG: sigma factor, partial [Oscillospiraceae bacterium]|nr:sigma factor [Oscillospiraceae bacterium]
MEDNEIIDLYWQRQEQAIAATDMKYGRMCMYIAGHILSAREDAEECVSDTYLACWNTMPPKRPNVLSAFVSRITRNLSLKRYEYLTAEKRNQNAAVSLEELGDCLSGTETP